MTPATRPRLLVVDDHPEMRDRIVAKLAQTCEIVGAADDGPSALTAVERCRPTVVVLDLSLPGGMNGIEVAAHLRRDDPAIRIVFHSAHDDEDLKAAAKMAGANAYVVKRRLDDLAREIV